MNRIPIGALFLFALTLYGNAIPATASCSNQCTSGDVPCSLLGDYLSSSVLSTSKREWAPKQGRIFVVDDDVVEVVFRFDNEAIDVLRSRDDFAFEVDFVDLDGVVSDDWSYSTSGFPSGVVVTEDSPQFDTNHQLSVIIFNPHLFKANEDYTIRFRLGDSISQRGRLKLNVDLSVYWQGDYLRIPPCPMLRPDQGRRSALNYFTLEIEQYAAFWYNPQSTSGICWLDKLDSGFQYCTNYASHTDSGATTVPQDEGDYVIISQDGLDDWVESNPPSTTPIGTDPQPISGPRVDLRPDFDIKDIDGDELSSNCDNYETKPLRPNQEIKLVLTTQVSNEDAGNFKRDDDSNSIEGPIWYRMGAGDSWHKIVG